MVSNKYIGILGLFNLSLLTFITLWRTIRFLSQCENQYFSTRAFRKKLFFHVFLLLATLVDIPMYVSFLLFDDYNLILYSFHRFESAFLFAAFSITIGDWGALLLDIQEFRLHLFLLRKATLIAINVVYMLISTLNFVFCYSLNDFDSYLSSPENIAGIFIQIFVTLLLTSFMLHAGLKLSWRLRGAAGDNANHGYQDIFTSWLKRRPQSENEKNSSGRTLSTVRSNATVNAKEFNNAIWTLNIVMATCSVCIFIQSVLLTLNYTLGYASSSSATVGPTMFYWVFYFWVPLWGPILSLLYLSRTHTRKINEDGGLKRSHRGSYSSRNLLGDFSGLLNPLVSDEDCYSRNDTDLNDADDLFRDTHGDLYSSAPNSKLNGLSADSEEDRMGQYANRIYVDKSSAYTNNNSIDSVISNDVNNLILRTPMTSSRPLPPSGHQNIDNISPYHTGALISSTSSDDDQADNYNNTMSRTSSTIDTLIEQHDGKVVFSLDSSLSYPFRSDTMNSSSFCSPNNHLLHNIISPSDLNMRPSESFVHFRTDLDSSMAPFLNVPHDVSFDGKAFQNSECSSTPGARRDHAHWNSS